MLSLSGTAGSGSGITSNTGIYLCIGDGKVTVGFYRILGGGFYGGFGASGGAEFTIAPFATKFSDIEGFSMVTGGSASFPIPLPVTLSGGIEIGMNPMAEGVLGKLKSSTLAFTFSVATQGPPEVHEFPTHTKSLWEIDLTDRFKNITDFDSDIASFIANGDMEGLKTYVEDPLRPLLPLLE
jgi:hypothetical protein